MTIAICCVTAEGVVMGADSTASFMDMGGFHYLNHNQKIFEIGENSTFSIITWGLGNLGDMSYRTLIARLADALTINKATSVQDVADRWIDLFWSEYSTRLSGDIAELKHLDSLQPFGGHSPQSGPSRSEQEESRFAQLKLGLYVGFCIGGHHDSDRVPQAFEIKFDPINGKPKADKIVIGDTRCYGAPKIFDRIIMGLDPDVRAAIIASGKWTGTPAELDQLTVGHYLYRACLPLRDAIDFVHSCVASTIKAIKFSALSQTCGGPIELGVISTDRTFRWVRHKEWDVAIDEGHRRS
ncbi:hypothetical protein [Acetobacter persici]|uniref:hypothetical protein n=1 Tax=Acetobacter persici TaxID=1076596 RepID=UPI001F1FE11F|nr:hypothetical protein [Acetobacter persici]MCG0998266.1 hypothetical protein [Acetobacter persici]